MPQRTKQRRWTDGDLADIARAQAANSSAIAAPVVEVATTAPRRMNRLEAEYAQCLEWEKRAGLIQWWRFEAIKLRLADRTFLTIDFPVLLPNGALELRETKGFMREDAGVKLKVAQEMYPFFRFIVVHKINGCFVLKDVAKGL